VAIAREKIEAEYLVLNKDPEAFASRIRELFRAALAEDTAVKDEPIRHADDVAAREGRQRRRPISAPNTGTPEEITLQYLAKTPQGRRGINLGCGGMTFAEWLNIDFDQPHHADIVWDLTKGLPFLPDSEFDIVFSEAFLEHVTRRSAMAILNDSYRALRPGGHIRIAIPDLDLFIGCYVNNGKGPGTSEAFREEYGAAFNTRCEFFNMATRGWGHTYMYNREEIETLLRYVGFVDVKAVEIRHSEVPLLHDRENRPAEESSLITEARKSV
jgi:predicted SAM-dependent methyltransferase